jgi:hypothetical protein
MLTNASEQPMYGAVGAQRSPTWRLSLRWPVLWRAGPVHGRGTDLGLLSDHLRRDIGLTHTNILPDAGDRRYARFL